MAELNNLTNVKLLLHLKIISKNFQINPKCRLLNPAKSEIGIISKHYIEKILEKTMNKN